MPNGKSNDFATTSGKHWWFSLVGDPFGVARCTVTSLLCLSYPSDVVFACQVEILQYRIEVTRTNFFPEFCIFSGKWDDLVASETKATEN